MRKTNYNVDVRNEGNTMVALPSNCRGYELSEKGMMKSLSRILLSKGISKEQLNSFYNALSLAQRLFPEGGQVSCGEYLITYGDEIENNIPDWKYHNLAHYNHYVIKYFKAYLRCYFNDDNIIYKTDYDKIFVIELQDNESILEAVRLFKYEASRGYCYTNDFSFRSSNVIATYRGGFHGYQELINQSYFDLLRKMCVLYIKNSGYDFIALSVYPASIVQDYHCNGRTEFFELYFEEYGYVDALKLDLNDLAYETYILSYTLACHMLEIWL